MAMTRDPMCPSPPPVLLLAGPTAVGKSEIALCLARQLDGEIISVDSMQVYRGLDVGTAKPSPEEHRLVPHHLIDVAGLGERFDAARFASLARIAIAEIHSRRRLPILSGGTGLYFKVFLEGLGDAPAADPLLRAELGATPLPELLRELELRDRPTFEKIDRQNPRRVVRALEVIRLTGRPFSGQRAAWVGQSSNNDGAPPTGQVFFALARQPADLHARINARVDNMFRNGLVAETARLLELGLAENPTAMQAIGYRQVVEHLRGRRSLEDTVELVKLRTRQFAKRQMTWFRRQARPVWLQLAPQDAAATAAGRVRESFESMRAQWNS
jgi:tRNA dimethylallyltransferase